MKVNISFKHVDSSEHLKGYAEEKTSKLEKYFQGKINVTWTFGKERENFVAHCHLVGNSMDYFGESEATDIYATVELALDKIEKQIRKHKEIVTDHLHKNARVQAS